MVEKFTGIGFNANALNLDFLRDQEGQPLKTPNSFLVLHNPVRQKINEIIDEISSLTQGTDFESINIGGYTIDNSVVESWNSAVANSHSHDNLSYLNYINQNLASDASVSFSNLNITSTKGLKINSKTIVNVEGTQNIILGEDAGANNSGSQVILVGFEAGKNNSGSANVAIGRAAGYQCAGTGNFFLGSQAGFTSGLAYNNVFIGNSSGLYNTTGGDNLYIGKNSGQKGTTASRNTLLGVSAGYNNITGSDNIFLGRYAGFNETGSNKLYISNSDTSPWIYGDKSGSNYRIGINTTTLSAVLTVNGDINILNNGLNVNSNSVIGSDRSFHPVALADSVSTNNSLYYSNDLGSIVYKDASGSVKALDLNLSLGNLSISGNTLYAVNDDGDVILAPNGSGNAIINNGKLFVIARDSSSGGGEIKFQGANSTNDWAIDNYNDPGASYLRFIGNGNTYATLKDTTGFWCGLGVVGGNLSFSGNTLSTIDTNGNLIISPNGTGNISISNDHFIDFGPNSSWGQYLRIGGNGHTSNAVASICTTNGNLHIDPKDEYYTYLNYYSGNGVYFGDGNSSGVMAYMDITGQLWKSSGGSGYYFNAANSLIPDVNNAIDIGSNTKKIANVFVGAQLGVGTNIIPSSSWIRGAFGDGTNGCIVVGTLVDSGGLYPRAAICAHNAAQNSFEDLMLNTVPGNQGGGNIFSRDHFPIGDGTYDLGSSGFRWNDIYATNVYANYIGSSQDIVINKASGNPAFQFQSASSTKFQMYYDVTNAQVYAQNLTSDSYFSLLDSGKIIFEAKNSQSIDLVADTIDISSITIQSNQVFSASGVCFPCTTSEPIGSIAVYPGLQSISTDNGAAWLSFHRPGILIAKLGLDTDNVLKYGGGSYGTTAYRIWHEGSPELIIDNLKLDGNTLSSINTNGDVILAPNSSGNVVINNGNLVVKAQDASYEGGEIKLEGVTGTNYWVIDNYNTFGPSYMRFHSAGTVYATLKDTTGFWCGLGVVGGNLSFSGNTLSTIDTNGNLVITPNGTGNISVSNDHFIDFGPNSSWGQYLRIGGNGHTSNAVASICTTNGNLHIDPKDEFWTYLNFYSGNGVYFGDGNETAIVATMDNTGLLTCNGVSSSLSVYAAGLNSSQDIVINKASGNPAFQFQSASSTKFQMYYDVTNAQVYAQNVVGTNYFSLNDSGKIIFEAKNSQNIELIGSLIDIHGQLGIWGNAIIASNGSIIPVSVADSAAANNTLYYSSDSSKLCYKDYGGTVHELY